MFFDHLVAIKATSKRTSTNRI